MARFALSSRAFADLEAIAAYTEKTWGAARRDAYLDVIEARLTLLAEASRIGAERSDLRPGVRSFPVESHVVYYVEAAFGVSIVRVLHKRQDPHRHL